MSKKRRMKHVDTDDVGRQEQEKTLKISIMMNKEKRCSTKTKYRHLKTPSCREENWSLPEEKARNRKLVTTTRRLLNWRKTNTKKTDLKLEPSAEACALRTVIHIGKMSFETL